MSWRATVPCSRAQGTAIVEVEADELFPGSERPPVLVADEPDPTVADSWLIHAYFEQQPTRTEIAALTSLGSAPPKIKRLAEQDWITISQTGLPPVRAGRFHVHTPTHRPVTERINLEIDAGLAFGTGQHATTAGCLEALDRLQQSGAAFRNIADIGTGTGLLAFAALALWPDAKCIATDIDEVAVAVASKNAAINGFRLGQSVGELLIVHAEGMQSPVFSARAPFDLLIANILAGPLIKLAGDLSSHIAAEGTIVLAGLLDTQAQAVQCAFEQHRLAFVARSAGEWPVLIMKKNR